MKWIGPRKCEAGACGQAARAVDGVLLRSSLRPDETITFTDAEWRSFVRAICDGDFVELTDDPR